MMTKRKEHLRAALYALHSSSMYIGEELRRPTWPSESPSKRRYDIAQLTQFRERIQQLCQAFETYTNDHDKDPFDGKAS